MVQSRPSALLRLILIACTWTALGFVQPEPDESQPLPKLELPDFATLQSGTVTRILDENTVLIDTESRTARYDLLGVSSVPPRDRRNTTLAIDTLSRLLLGESVLIQHDPNGERNAANRLAAYIYRLPDHLPINLELVRQGYTRFSQAGMSIHSDVFEHYEHRARDLERGIWNPNTPATPETQTETQPDRNQPSRPERDTAQPIAPTIFITTYGTKYHRKDCPHLTDTARPATREEVDATHEPCKTCKPDSP